MPELTMLMLTESTSPTYPSAIISLRHSKAGSVLAWRPTMWRKPDDFARVDDSCASARLAPKGHSQKTFLDAPNAANTISR